jgi:hypothetical protein
MSKINEGWFDANKHFPPFNTEVLGYYRIISQNKKEGHVIFEYYVIVKCESVLETMTGKYPKYVDSNYDNYDIECWSELKPPFSK